MDDAEKPIPLSIVTGFLGSGKTTFLEHILSSPSLELFSLDSDERPRIAVVMNEFAPGSSVERLFLQHLNSNSTGDESNQHSTNEVLDLPNGCLCCSIKSGGLRAIEQLIRTRGPFHHILLETSGLSEPAPLIHSFWTDEAADGLGALVCLNAVVAVLDLVHAARYLPVSGEDEYPAAPAPAPEVALFARQLALADVILLNKTDLLPTASLAPVLPHLSAPPIPLASESNTAQSGNTDANTVAPRHQNSESCPRVPVPQMQPVEVLRAIRRMNPHARIYCTRFGALPATHLRQVLALDAYRSDTCCRDLHEHSHSCELQPDSLCHSRLLCSPSSDHSAHSVHNGVGVGDSSSGSSSFRGTDAVSNSDGSNSNSTHVDAVTSASTSDSVIGSVRLSFAPAVRFSADRVHELLDGLLWEKRFGPSVRVLRLKALYMRCTCTGGDESVEPNSAAAAANERPSGAAASSSGGSGQHRADCGQAVVLQAVHELYDERDLCAAEAQRQHQQHESTFVFIGYALDRNALSSALNSCIAA